MNWAPNAFFCFLVAPPGALARGQKVKYLISITKSISKIFIPNFVCVLINEDTKHIFDRFFILSPGSCPRGGTWGYLGAKIEFHPYICPLCYLLLNHRTKFNQIWCVSYSHEWGKQHQNFFGPFPWRPGEGSKGQISFNFNYKVNFKDFSTNFVRVLPTKTYANCHSLIIIFQYAFCTRNVASGTSPWRLRRVLV